MTRTTKFVLAALPWYRLDPHFWTYANAKPSASSKLAEQTASTCQNADFIRQVDKD